VPKGFGQVQKLTEFHKKLQTNAQKNADMIHGPGRFVQALQDYCLIFGVSKSNKMMHFNNGFATCNE